MAKQGDGPAPKRSAVVKIKDTTPAPREETAESVVPFAAAEALSLDNAERPELQKYRRLSVVGIKRLGRRDKQYTVGGPKSVLLRFLSDLGLDKEQA